MRGDFFNASPLFDFCLFCVTGKGDRDGEEERDGDEDGDDKGGGDGE
jgi:hypothetical protein